MSAPDEHIISLVAAVARVESKLDSIDKALNGNGMPGIVQKVEELEEHKNKLTGGLAVIGVIGTGIWGVLEWFFHFTKSGGGGAAH